MAASGFTEWYFQLFDMRVRTRISDSTALMNVMTQNSPVLLTLFSDDRGTALTQPITATNGVWRFFTASTTTALDLSGTTANGYSFFMEDVAPDDHRIDINTAPNNQQQTMIVPYAVTASGVVADSGRKLSVQMGVRDAYLKIFTLGTSVTMDVGTSTLANSGFMAGMTTDTTGWRCVSEAAAAGLGLKGTSIRVAVTATLNNVCQIHIPANATSGLSVTYQMTTAGAQTPAGYIYLEYSRLPGV